MYLRRLRLKSFCGPEEAAQYPEVPAAYKACCVCQSDNPKSALLLKSVRELDQQDRDAFGRGMKTLLKLANSGRTPKSHYDEKQCHECHSFEHGEKTLKVMRIRTGDLRTLFFYGEDKMLLLIDAFPKHKDKLTKAQKQHAERVIKQYLEASMASNIHFCKEDP